MDFSEYFYTQMFIYAIYKYIVYNGDVAVDDNDDEDNVCIPIPIICIYYATYKYLFF